MQVVRILDQLRRDNSGTDGSPAIEALAQSPLPASLLDLPVSLRDVVANGVAENVIQCLRFRDFTSFLADNDDEFTFVVEARIVFDRERMDRDRIGWAGDGSHWLEKENGIFWNSHVGFFGMLFVVQTEAADCLDVVACERGEEHAYVGDGVGHAVSAKDVTFDDTGRSRAGDVSGSGREDGIAVVDATILCEETYEAL